MGDTACGQLGIGYNSVEKCEKSELNLPAVETRALSQLPQERGDVVDIL